MPNFHFTKMQALDLTYYMLSLTSENMGTYYSSMRSIPGPAYGRQLFVEKNCIACHAIGGVGMKTGPDLLGVTKRHSMEWLDEQLVNPELVYPGSSMPEYDLEINARKALVAFMRVATPEDAQSILSGRPRALKPEEISIEAGKQDFARFGCVGCHGTELQGGVANPNAQGGEVPSLLHVSDDYTKDGVSLRLPASRTAPLQRVLAYVERPAGGPGRLHDRVHPGRSRFAGALWSAHPCRNEVAGASLRRWGVVNKS